LRGAESEYLVEEHFIQKKYILVTKNIKIFSIEVDLLFLSPAGELVIVEVKSVGDEVAWRNLVSEKQKLRLKRVFDHLISTSPRPIRAHLAAVNHSKDIHIHEDYLATPMT
jgi:Holliday junction resolvase-like predicted endonuclease